MATNDQDQNTPAAPTQPTPVDSGGRDEDTQPNRFRGGRDDDPSPNFFRRTVEAKGKGKP